MGGLSLGLSTLALGGMRAGGGAADLPTPLSDAWAAAVTANSGTYSPTTLAAVQELERDLTIASLTAKIIYLNPHCGSNIAAAKVPLIRTPGAANDTHSGTFAAWDETQGLKGTTGIADTGVNASTAGFTVNAASLGVYMLTDAPTTNSGIITATSTNFKLVPSAFGQYILFDEFNGGTSGRIQTDSTLLADGGLTKGLILGSRYGANLAFVSRNGVIRGQATIAAGSTPASETMKYVTALGQSGGMIMGLDLTPEDASNLTWIMHTFNKSLSRGVTAEGLF